MDCSAGRNFARTSKQPQEFQACIVGMPECPTACAGPGTGASVDTATMRPTWIAARDATLRARQPWCDTARGRMHAQARKRMRITSCAAQRRLCRPLINTIAYSCEDEITTTVEVQLPPLLFLMMPLIMLQAK